MAKLGEYIGIVYTCTRTCLLCIIKLCNYKLIIRHNYCHLDCQYFQAIPTQSSFISKDISPVSELQAQVCQLDVKLDMNTSTGWSTMKLNNTVIEWGASKICSVKSMSCLILDIKEAQVFWISNSNTYKKYLIIFKLKNLAHNIKFFPHYFIHWMPMTKYQTACKPFKLRSLIAVFHPPLVTVSFISVSRSYNCRPISVIFSKELF